MKTMKIAIVLSGAVLAYSSCAFASKCACKAPKAAGEDSDAAVVATQPGVAGGMIAETYTETATVTALDKATRKVTLTGKDGAKVTFKAGPEVANFDQIKVGDVVKATVASELVVFVRKPGAPSTDGAAGVVAAAPLGEKPGVVVAGTEELTAKVKSIDAKHRQATLVLADGTTKTIPVRKDVDLTKYAAGDEVVFRVTEAMAISVEKP
jgi:hypothetical protein